MSSYLYSYPEPLVFDPETNPAPGDLVPDRVHDGQYIYLSGSPLDYPGGLLIGQWTSQGALVGQVDPLYQELRPFANDEDGFATNQLDYHHWQGHAQRDMQEEAAPDTLMRYPAQTQPITLTMERVWDATPGWEGHGWQATIEFADPDRPPNARAIGIYSEAWAYLYTTGAFVWTDTGEVDGDGQPIFKWRTHNPPGRATPEKESLYYALLLGAAQEGKMELWPVMDTKTNFFWGANQVTPGGSSWVDSGETVVDNYGAVTATSSNEPFTVGAQVRIEGAEAVVGSLWVGAGQGIVLDPYVLRTVGATIEIWS